MKNSEDIDAYVVRVAPNGETNISYQMNSLENIANMLGDGEGSMSATSNSTIKVGELKNAVIFTNKKDEEIAAFTMTKYSRSNDGIKSLSYHLYLASKTLNTAYNFLH